jgi:hypothetical protein
MAHHCEPIGAMAEFPAIPGQPRPVVALTLLGALLALQGPAAWAGSATAESIWDRTNALERAREQVPAGATVTRERCQEIEVGLDNIRYRCSVEWQSPSETGPDPAHLAPPGR